MSGLLLLLNQDSPVPPYEQINLQLQTLITSSQLLPGTRLPSVRQLARDLGVAPNTVVRAYGELERNGWVVTSMRKGIMVAAHPPLISREERQQRLQQMVAELLVTARQLDLSVEDLHDELERQWNEGDAGRE
ncbi:GntR family transcriptional regulator [Dictyobacter alpinus]|uniref:GntR family transcriptional regulator n=1 Tax=Dictyobacter alpinus TaxID=2014873 RepID=A0A402BAJ2_9CHLR|nr:GntR family transcriptional regulator [Dictyobacter alpinus]GCE28418.1 GntR family transcriptional regulator [Dictyobacter alpinus]